MRRSQRPTAPGRSQRCEMQVRRLSHGCFLAAELRRGLGAGPRLPGLCGPPPPLAPRPPLIVSGAPCAAAAGAGGRRPRGGAELRGRGRDLAGGGAGDGEAERGARGGSARCRPVPPLAWSAARDRLHAPGEAPPEDKAGVGGRAWPPPSAGSAAHRTVQ